MPVTKKQYHIFYSNIFLCIVFCLLFTYNACAQLTYAQLSVQYDSAWVCNNLQLIPIKFKDTAAEKSNFTGNDFISFGDAMREGKVTVKEMSTLGGADVGMLTVKNHSKKNILIESGELVAGGKQDRAFANTTIIPPGDEENYVPVFCVEKGRWENRIGAFRYAGSADAAVKKQINTSKRQNKVWKEIDRQLAAKKDDGPTSAYLDLYRDSTNSDTACLNYFRQKMMESDSLYTGFIAITGNEIISCEIFANSSLCSTSFDAMLKSYLRTVHDKNSMPLVSNTEVKTFVDNFLKTETQQQTYLANHGSIYTYGKEVIHIIAYP